MTEQRPGIASRYAVDITFAALVGLGFAYAVWASRHYYFSFDDWRLLRQSRSLGGMVDEYNGHLSILILGIYRGLVELVAFDYTPFRVVGAACMFAVPVLYYATTRRHLGPLLAAVISVCLLSGGQNGFLPMELNHSLALVGGILCAAALNRGAAADPWLALALVFSLAAAGGGAAVAVACGVHCACTRAPLRRWLAVGVPSLAWFGWWVMIGRQYDTPPGASLGAAVRFSWTLVVASFTSLAGGAALLGALLMAAFLLWGLFAMRQGLAEGANWLAWVAALTVWAVGLSYSRGSLADAHTFRYQLLAIGFAALAIVPRQPMHLGGRVAVLSHPAVAVGVLLFVFAMSAQHVVHDSRDLRGVFTLVSTLNQGRVIALSQRPLVVPDDQKLPFEMGALRASEVRALLRAHGSADAARGDRELVERGVVQSISTGSRHDGRCTPTTEPIIQPTTSPRLQLWSSGVATRIEVRRFDDEWVPVDQLVADEVVRLRLPPLESAVPWQVRAIGACALA